jgi:hypothetical protein
VERGDAVDDLGNVAAAARRRAVGLLDPRLPFLVTLTLAPLYGIVDVVQQLTPGPNTIFSEFYALPEWDHALAFIALYVGAWLLWYAVLRMTGATRDPAHLLLQVSQVRAARPLLWVYLGVVLVVFLLVWLRGGLGLGLGVQAALLIFTYVYAGFATRRGQGHADI